MNETRPGGSNDPRIQQIRDAMAKDPKITRHECRIRYGVARQTLDRWVAMGLLPKLYVQTPEERTAHWRKVK